MARERVEAARQSMGLELEQFAENTLSYLSQERHLLIDDPDIPDIFVSDPPMPVRADEESAISSSATTTPGAAITPSP